MCAIDIVRTTLIIKFKAFDTLNGHDSDSADLSFLHIDLDLKHLKMFLLRQLVQQGAPEALYVRSSSDHN